MGITLYIYTTLYHGIELGFYIISYLYVHIYSTRVPLIIDTYHYITSYIAHE